MSSETSNYGGGGVKGQQQVWGLYQTAEVKRQAKLGFITEEDIKNDKFLHELGKQGAFQDAYNHYTTQHQEPLKAFRKRVSKHYKAAMEEHEAEDFEEFEDAREKTSAETLLELEEEHQKDQHDLEVKVELEKKVTDIGKGFNESAKGFQGILKKDQDLDERILDHNEQVSLRIKDRKTLTRDFMLESIKTRDSQIDAARQVAEAKTKANKSGKKLENAMVTFQDDIEAEQAEESVKENDGGLLNYFFGNASSKTVTPKKTTSGKLKTVLGTPVGGDGDDIQFKDKIEELELRHAELAPKPVPATKTPNKKNPKIATPARRSARPKTPSKIHNAGALG